MRFYSNNSNNNNNDNNNTVQGVLKKQYECIYYWIMYFQVAVVEIFHFSISILMSNIVSSIFALFCMVVGFSISNFLLQL